MPVHTYKIQCSVLRYFLLETPRLLVFVAKCRYEGLLNNLATSSDFPRKKRSRRRFPHSLCISAIVIFFSFLLWERAVCIFPQYLNRGGKRPGEAGQEAQQQSPYCSRDRGWEVWDWPIITILFLGSYLIRPKKPLKNMKNLYETRPIPHPRHP